MTRYIWKRSTEDADAGIVCPGFFDFSWISTKKSPPPNESIGRWSISPDERSKTCFDKKKSFKILLEIVQIYGDGRGFQNLACFRSSRVSGLETFSQAVPPVSSGAGILFFCADAIGIPPKEKKTIARRSSSIVRGERLEKGWMFLIVVLLLILFTPEQIFSIE